MDDGIPRAVKAARVPEPNPGGEPMEFSLRHAPCACGGYIYAGGSSASVAAKIQAHNNTPRHTAWRKRQGIK